MERIQSLVRDLSASASDVLNFIDSTVIQDYEKSLATSEKYDEDPAYFNQLFKDFLTQFTMLHDRAQYTEQAVSETLHALQSGANSIAEIVERNRGIAQRNDEVVKQAKQSTSIAEEIRQIVKRFRL